MNLQGGFDAAVDDLGLEAPGSEAVHAAGEHHGDVVGAPEVELVAQRLLKPSSPGGRPVEPLDLPRFGGHGVF